jgi:hypothetical protein
MSRLLAEYQKKHVSGVFSLVHRVPTLEAYNQELERLHAYMDTEPEGKYVLGLIYVREGVVETTADVPPTLTTGHSPSVSAGALLDLRAPS